MEFEFLKIFLIIFSVISQKYIDRKHKGYSYPYTKIKPRGQTNVNGILI